MPVSWHENCLKNMTDTYIKEMTYIKNLQDHADRLKSDCEVLTAQIRKAKKLNIESFDKSEAKFTKDLCITVQV